MKLAFCKFIACIEAQSDEKKMNCQKNKTKFEEILKK